MTYLRTALAALAFASFSTAVQAQLVVVGKGDAAACYQSALHGDKGSKSALKSCSAALTQHLSHKDRAATFVNRGVLNMRRGDQEAAVTDYESALKMKPNLTEAHVNYGVSLIYQENYDKALTVLNTALKDKESKTRHLALYNRAIVFDRKENYRGAYYDLKAALAINPDWDPALQLISRYEVKPAG